MPGTPEWMTGGDWVDDSREVPARLMVWQITAVHGSPFEIPEGWKFVEVLASDGGYSSVDIWFLLEAV